jgi:hypothetical protein
MAFMGIDEHKLVDEALRQAEPTIAKILIDLKGLLETVIEEHKITITIERKDK